MSSVNCLQKPQGWCVYVCVCNWTQQLDKGSHANDANSPEVHHRPQYGVLHYISKQSLPEAISFWTMTKGVLLQVIMSFYWWPVVFWVVWRWLSIPFIMVHRGNWPIISASQAENCILIAHHQMETLSLRALTTCRTNWQKTWDWLLE